MIYFTNVCVLVCGAGVMLLLQCEHMKKTVLQIGIFILFFTVTIFQNVEVTYAVEPHIDANIVLLFTNVERYREGVPILSSNEALSNTAKEKMTDLFTRGYFAHESPTGETVSDLARKNGYEFIVVGENLALGDFTSSKGVVDAWMNSKGHKENILADKYTEIGIAAGRGNYNGRVTWIVVQSFGRPKSSCPIIDKVLEDKIETWQKKLELYSRVAEYRRVEAERSDGTISERKARVLSYNVIAKFYNSSVERYTELVEEYNKEVGDYNSCLKEVVKDF
jgi:hypothetical protein